jgi:predicted nucleic acid-binding protein
MDMAERYGFFYDSLIISPTLLPDCSTWHSEDMQLGKEFKNRMVIANPFLVENEGFLIIKGNP